MIRKRTMKNGKDHYQVIVKVKGYPHKVKTFPSKRGAESWEIKLKAAMKSGHYYDDAEAQRQTLGNAIDRYLTEILSPDTKNRKTILGQLAWWKQKLGKYALARISSDAISRAKEELSKEITCRLKQRSPATVNRYLATLSLVLSATCNDWGWLQESPIKRVRKLKEPRGRVRFLEYADRERILQTCRKSKSEHLYLVVVLALSTGMRKGEILGLQWDHIDLETGKAILHHTKNGERRVVPITGYALDELKAHASLYRFRSTYVFANSAGTAPVAITTSWNNAVKLAGIADFKFHDLRHCAASYLAMNGATSGEIAEVLGHKTLAMVKRYAHLSETHTKGVVTKMNDAIFGKTG